MLQNLTKNHCHVFFVPSPSRAAIWRFLPWIRFLAWLQYLLWSLKQCFATTDRFDCFGNHFILVHFKVQAWHCYFSAGWEKCSQNTTTYSLCFSSSNIFLYVFLLLNIWAPPKKPSDNGWINSYFSSWKSLH